MALRPLSTRLLLDLLDLFEQSSQAIGDAKGQRLHGIPGWHIINRTSLSADEISAWTERVGYVGSYPADIRDECVAVDLHEDDGPDRYWYRCPETFRKKYVSAADAAVYTLSAPKLLNQIATLLDIPQALRRMIDTPAIEGVLWQLGEARIGPARAPVWFARGLSQSADAVFRHLRLLTLPEQGLILISGQPLPDFVQPPRNYRFATIAHLPERIGEGSRTERTDPQNRAPLRSAERTTQNRHPLEPAPRLCCLSGAAAVSGQLHVSGRAAVGGRVQFGLFRQRTVLCSGD